MTGAETTGRERELMDLLDGVIFAKKRLTKQEFARLAGFKSAPGVAFRDYPTLRGALEAYVDGWRGKRANLQPPSAEAERERLLGEREQQVASLRAALERARDENRRLEERLAASEAARREAVRVAGQARAMVTALVRKVLVRNPSARAGMAIELDEALTAALRDVGVEVEAAGDVARVLPLREEGA